MRFPGDLTETELEAAFQQFYKSATEKWGEDQAAQTEDVLRETAAAVARLAQIKFSRTDVPGFYLTETGFAAGSLAHARDGGSDHD